MEQMASDYSKLKPRLSRLSNDIDMILMDNVLPMDIFAEALKAYLDAHRAYLRHERGSVPRSIISISEEEVLEELRQALPEGAEREKLERLQQAYPELYAELRGAEVPSM